MFWRHSRVIGWVHSSRQHCRHSGGSYHEKTFAFVQDCRSWYTVSIADVTATTKATTYKYAMRDIIDVSRIAEDSGEKENERHKRRIRNGHFLLSWQNGRAG